MVDVLELESKLYKKLVIDKGIPTSDIVATTCFMSNRSSFDEATVGISFFNKEGMKKLLNMIDYEYLCDKSNIIINEVSLTIIFLNIYIEDKLINNE